MYNTFEEANQRSNALLGVNTLVLAIPTYVHCRQSTKSKNIALINKFT